MRMNEEMDVYNSAPVSSTTGETESYDNYFFPHVIRKKELELFHKLLNDRQPTLILDYGCGGGWLSLLIQRWGFTSVGMDISINMVKTAKKVCPNREFIVCDATHLPFVDTVFDFVMGISILHHLPFYAAIEELKRVSLPDSMLLFMEPSSLNPLSAFGRKLFPMEAHTPDEKPFTPGNFKQLLSLNGFYIEQYFTDFFLSFPIARLNKVLGLHPPSMFIKLTYYFETLMESIYGLKYLNGNIVAIVSPKG